MSPGLRVNMSEDELLVGITDALTIAGWRWTHIRRSDGVTMGHSGLPDIVAAHPDRAKALAWELKGDGGVLFRAIRRPGRSRFAAYLASTLG